MEYNSIEAREMRSRRVRGCRNRYWRLVYHDDLHVKGMRDLLRKRSYAFGSTMNKDKLGKHLFRSEQGLMSYHNIDNDVLRQFIKARNIDISALTVGNRTGQRVDLLEALETADANLTFHPFMRLPPELRNHVYELYMASFGQPLYAPSQPPLSMTCRRIRDEFLPMFYAKCTFLIPFRRERIGINTYTLHMADSQLLFLRSTTPAHIAAIRRLSIMVVAGWGGLEKLDAWATLEVKLPLEGEVYQIDRRQPQIARSWVRQEDQEAMAESLGKAASGVKDVIDSIVARPGKDRLQVEDVFALRTALETAYNTT